MKFLVVLSLLVFISCQKQETTTSTPAEEVTTGAAKLEDCDDKAKEKVEIKDEGISLSGGDTGCTLEEEPQK